MVVINIHNVELGKVFLDNTQKIHKTKEKKKNWSNKIKNSVCKRTLLRLLQYNPQNGGKYHQITYLIQDCI